MAKLDLLLVSFNDPFMSEIKEKSKCLNILGVMMMKKNMI
jgi:hypothetical protein